MTMVIRSLSLHSPARSRWRSSLASCLLRQPGSNAFQKSSTAQKSSSRLMVGCLSVRGNVEDNTSFERHPALSITHVIHGLNLKLPSFHNPTICLQPLRV